MYCMKCAKQLPDDAQFCLSCGNPTAVGTSNPYVQAQAPAFAANNEHIKNEIRQKLEDSNRRALEDISKKLETAKQQRRTRVTVCLILAAISGLLCFIFSVSVMNNGILSSPEMFIAALIAFAVTAGILLGTSLLYTGWNKVIREYEQELEQLENKLQ